MFTKCHWEICCDSNKHRVTGLILATHTHQISMEGHWLELQLANRGQQLAFFFSGVELPAAFAAVHTII